MTFKEDTTLRVNWIKVVYKDIIPGYFLKRIYKYTKYLAKEGYIEYNPKTSTPFFYTQKYYDFKRDYLYLMRDTKELLHSNKIELYRHVNKLTEKRVKEMVKELKRGAAPEE